jgi:hypothetical protein
MKMTVTSAQRTFTATLKTILPYNLFLLYLYGHIEDFEFSGLTTPPPAPGQHTHTPKAKGISLVLFFSALFFSLLSFRRVRDVAPRARARNTRAVFSSLLPSAGGRGL